MSSSKLKIIACLAMLIDHMGMVLVDSSSPVYVAMRIIGRIAFPIFAFMIVEGFFHTRNVYKYMGRLLLFALISEIPYDMAGGMYVNMDGQNIFFTLFFGLLTVYIFDRLKEKQISIFIVVFMGIITELIGADYGIYGIVTVMFFYVFRDNWKKLFMFYFAITALLGLMASWDAHGFSFQQYIQLFAVFSLFLTKQYNGKKGINIKYIFYVFYPGHLLILGIIRMYYL